ncbi:MULTISPECIES: hypothetical protein [unclassified Paenibacillus]|uniref:hypothetical protein n=1 Tax=unclassified Paenibacillus TaxID=185978 RepID=UPI0030DC8D69
MTVEINWDAVAASGSIVFSFFLLIASVKAAKAADRSALAAEESLKFNERQNVMQEKEREIMSKVYQERYRNDAIYIHNVLSGIASGAPNKLAIKKAKLITLPSPYEFAQFFNETQIDALPKIIKVFDKHYSDFWFDNDTDDFTFSHYELNSGPIKTMAFGVANEVEQLIKKI